VEPVEPVEDAEPELATCAICLEPMEEGGAVKLSCTHSFHAACVVPWLQKGNRSCPTCRNKPPRQVLGDGSESERSDYERSDYDSEYDSEGGDAAHRLLHDEWNHTWQTYLSDVRASEEAKRKALTRAKRLAQAARPRDKRVAREARRFVTALGAWKEKTKERVKERDVAERADRAARIELNKKHDENWRWYEKRLVHLRKERDAMNKAAEAALDLPGIKKERRRLERAVDKAKSSARLAEDKLAGLAGWEPPGPVPQLPDGLRDCMYQPTGPPF